ncbi:flagellar assembly protein FliW [Amnibacterium sp. CER49]|uniref:flagellar assembly protein FliW n=1 Tax=Amnibacterium sp. CER49 TaxID=3039161 RepID=UPI002447B744|nr:flagellar assembly protein FliW [Amnibacterium sp. CER49]MDH2443840.1 flagellar assembly protein FliW [Amnibacterium sp. CER49]
MSLSAPVSNALRLTFTAPPPGLAPLVEFELAPVPGGVGLYTLRDLAGADLRLFLVDPRFYVPEYAPGIPAEQLARLGAASPAELDVYVVATLAAEAPVVNLLAPILVNAGSASATQVILEEDWPLQAELIAA